MASNVPPHRAYAARQRFAWLNRFWRAERKANYRRRWAVAQRVVDAIKRADPKAATRKRRFPLRRCSAGKCCIGVMARQVLWPGSRDRNRRRSHDRPACDAEACLCFRARPGF